MEVNSMRKVKIFWYKVKKPNNYQKKDLAIGCGKVYTIGKSTKYPQSSA